MTLGEHERIEYTWTFNFLCLCPLGLDHEPLFGTEGVALLPPTWT